MCPSPRPLSWGTATPHAATSGASGSVILSPTPPVECLSAVGRDSDGEVHPFPRRDHGAGPAGDLAPVHAVEQDRHRQRRHLLVGDVAARVGVDHPVDLAVRQRALVPLRRDHLDRVVVLRHRLVLRRLSGPNASGSTSVIRATPETVHTRSSGPPFSQSSCRQRPQGISTSPCPSTQTKCVSRPPPVRCSSETSRTRHTGSRRTPRSRRCSPPPCGRRPPARRLPRGTGSTARRRAASPRTRPRAESARVRRRARAGQPLTYGSPSAAGARTRPTSPATARIVATYGSIAQEVRRDGGDVDREHRLQRGGEAEQQ